MNSEAFIPLGGVSCTCGAPGCQIHPETRMSEPDIAGRDVPSMLEADQPERGNLSELRFRSSSELADGVERVIRDVRTRIEGVGAEQYQEAEGQRFERLPLGDVFREAEEELLDTVVYACQLIFKLENLRRRVMRRLIVEANK